MIRITNKVLDNGVDVSFDDAENNLGFKFIAPKSDFTSQEGLAKIFEAISGYVNANYECLHQKTLNGVKVIDTKNAN